MNAEIIICACGRQVGVRLPDGSYEIRHHGRIIRCSGNIVVTCERCGRLTDGAAALTSSDASR